MGNSFESQARGYNDESEIRQDGFEFKSAGKKYINQNYKRICLALGIEGESLGIIKRQANKEKQLPDIQGELSLEQVNFYRQHYGFDSLSQDEYESMKSEKQPEPEVLPEPEIEGSEDKKSTRADFGDIPEDLYDIKNNDLEALNSLFDAKRDVFPNSQYVDIRNWAEWTPIEVVAPEKPNGKWLITKGVNHELVGDFDSETQANTEFDRIKNEDKQKALDLLKKARNFAIGEDLEAPWESEKYDAAEPTTSSQSNNKAVNEAEKNNREENLNIQPDVTTPEPLTAEQLEKNKKLYGWVASYELAKIAKSQNVDLSLLSREDYVDFAIQNKLMIDDNQLRMSPWQRMCESEEERNKRLEEMRALINPEADESFDKFSLEIKQKAGEDNRSIDNGILVRRGTNNSGHWLYFGINQGVDSSEDQIFKSYISLQDLNDLTPEKFTNFMQALRDSGYNGDIKIFQDLLSQGIRLNDQIVMHGASEADAKLGLDVADQFFGDSLAHKSSGIDMKIDGKNYSYSQVLAKKIKDSVQQEVTQQESIEDTKFEALQQELNRLIEVEAQKLQGEQAAENGSYQIDREKLERFKEESKQAIANYQKFASKHSSSIEKSNPQIQERYQLIEKEAWNSLRNLAHLLDGEIATLPQDRDIQLSHPEGVDIRQYLEARGYKFDEKGDITHITDNGVEIELNRPMKTDSLIKSRRPSHVVYPNPLRSSLISNDISEGFQQNVSISDSLPDRSWARPMQNDIDLDRNQDVSRPKYYHSYLTKGYIVKGLNQNTPDFITAILNQDMIGDVLVDETSKPNNTSEAIQDSWSAESSGETENEISDPWVAKATEINTGFPEQAEGEEDLPIYHPDRGSLYYQEIQLWNNIQALENRRKENPKDESVKLELEQAKQAYQEFRTDINNSTEQDKFKQFLELRESYAQAESENTRGRFWKLLGLKKKNNFELEDIRSQYNEALEALLKTETSIGVEVKIKEMFSDEVQRLSGERVVQTKELQEKNQSGLDRALNPLKDRIFNWYIKNKSAVGAVNLGLFATSTFLAFTGAGIPLAGAVNTLRHTIAYPMAVASGISGRELIRSKFEDENTNLNLDIKKFNLKTNFEFLKFKGGITKLVDKSLQDNYIQNASDEDLSKLVSTLESYYGLNGGKFTELNQQKAYEMGLNELGARLERANNKSTDEQDISSESNVSDGLDYKFDFKNTKEFKIKTVDGLVTRISQDRISALNDQKNKRLVANVAGTALGGSLLFNLVAQDLQLNKSNLGDSASTTGESRPKIPTTDSTPDTQGAGAGPSGASAPEVGASAPTSIPDASPTGIGASAEEALRQAQAVAEQTQELAQDVSSLSSGETIWGEMAKQLGPNASPDQIQHALENYLESGVGQNTMFELAEKTEGGRALLAQWSIDDAKEMASLSKEQLYEISRYLAPGELEGISNFNIDHLEAFQPAEYVESSPVVEPTVEPGSTEPPAPPASESAVVPPTSEAPTVAPSEVTRDLSEILGKQNLTDIQAREIVQSYFADDYGRVAIYNSIINTDEGARFLSQGFNIKNPADFANLTPDKMYEITNSLDADSWRRIINETVLSKFETADIVEIAKGDSPLGAINRYIAGEVGNLPYDSNLGKQVLDTYLQTDSGKQWLYDAIVSNPNPNNQNVQLFREYLRFKDIKSSEEFVTKFNWSEFSGNRNIPTSGFWNQIRLPNSGDRLQPLSTFLQPSQMTGIPEVIKQVLTRQ